MVDAVKGRQDLTDKGESVERVFGNYHCGPGIRTPSSRAGERQYDRECLD